MRRLALLAVAALVSVTGVTGCGGGGGDGSTYCNHIRDNVKNETIQNLDLTTKSGLQQARTELVKLRGEAPGEIRDDYDALIAGLDDVLAGKQPDAQISEHVSAIQKYETAHCDVTYKTG